jgi:hypothetical protein
MAAPYPPQGNQTPHTERPLKVYAEQYTAAGPLPVGASVEVVPPIYTDGRPRVYANGHVYDLAEGDWVISNRYTGQPAEVISDEEFKERFGGGGPPTITGDA